MNNLSNELNVYSKKFSGLNLIWSLTSGRKNFGLKYAYEMVSVKRGVEVYLFFKRMLLGLGLGLYRPQPRPRARPRPRVLRETTQFRLPSSSIGAWKPGARNKLAGMWRECFTTNYNGSHL